MGTTPLSATGRLLDGLVVVLRSDCPTCSMVGDVVQSLAQARHDVTIVAQDQLDLPAGVEVIDDTSLELSWSHDVETVPTLLRLSAGTEVDRTVGWDRDEWERVSGVIGLGPGLPPHRPGCGSLSVDPVRAAELRARFAGDGLRSRRVELASAEDEHEALFDLGWTDGLPVVPPTVERVGRMLDGTSRTPDDVVAVVGPDLVEATVEKVAINAVLAGCRPEYLPVVLAGVEAVCNDTFNIHGVLATTMSVGPVLVVNGPIARRIGMNSGVNVLGQGTRANLTIGRAVQLVVRNIGGGRPGEVDRATLGNPGKLAFCFAEAEDSSPWESLAAERGVPATRSAVTAFCGEGPRVVVDQLSRTPESLARSFAVALRTVAHPTVAMAFDAMLVVSPEHGARFRDAGWSKARLRDELGELLLLDGDELVRGAGGIAEGLPQAVAGARIPKFRPGGLLIVHAGGGAGL
ncbi:MAG: thioredoxin family protein, partial [Acidimicrobiales bacterium]|nr:thioredoxin family protein [Acidimicrobiales bacterium]